MAKLRNGIYDLIENLDKNGNYIRKRKRRKKTEKKTPTPAQQRNINRFSAASKFSHAIMNTEIKKFWRNNYMTEANLFMKKNIKAFNFNGEIEDYSMIQIIPHTIRWRSSLVYVIKNKTMLIHWKCYHSNEIDNEISALIVTKEEKSYKFQSEYLGHNGDKKAQLDISKYKCDSTVEVFLINTNKEVKERIFVTHVKIKL